MASLQLARHTLLRAPALSLGCSPGLWISSSRSATTSVQHTKHNAFQHRLGRCNDSLCLPSRVGLSVIVMFRLWLSDNRTSSRSLSSQTRQQAVCDAFAVSQTACCVLCMRHSCMTARHQHGASNMQQLYVSGSCFSLVRTAVALLQQKQRQDMPQGVFQERSGMIQASLWLNGLAIACRNSNVSQEQL